MGILRRSIQPLVDLTEEIQPGFQLLSEENTFLNTEINNTKEELQITQSNLQKTQANLHETQSTLHKTQSELQKTQVELNHFEWVAGQQKIRAELYEHKAKKRGLDLKKYWHPI